MDALELMLARRSHRRYTAEDVSAEHERVLLQAAFAAPSALNARPWHFVVVRDHATRQRLAHVHQWSGMLARTPLVIAVLGDRSSPWWIEDTSAATENALLQAQALGLGAVWVGIRDAEPGAHDESTVRRILAVPDGFGVLCLIGIGHPARPLAPRSQYQPTKVSYGAFGRRRP